MYSILLNVCSMNLICTQYIHHVIKQHQLGRLQYVSIRFTLQNVVGHPGTLQLRFYEYCEFGHYSFHILFFIYYIVGKIMILGAASCS